MLDVALSLAIAKEIGATTQACWYHALRAFIIYPELHTGQYVEGFAIPDQVKPKAAFEHGWLKRTDESIIDPAWVLLGNKRIDYFPGITYNYAQAATLVKGKKSVLLPLISQKYDDPFKCLTYFEAYKQSFLEATGQAPSKQDILFMVRLRSIKREAHP